MSSTGACANCGTSLHGPYCHACGQHESASHPATVGHLFHEQDGGVLVPQSEGDAYAAKLKRAYLSVRYLAVPIFALAVLALYRRRQPYYAGHVVLAAHYYSFWYLVSVATTPLPYVVGAVASFWLSVGYLWLALRRLFSEGIALATVKTLVLYAAMVAIEMGLALAAASWVAYWEA